MRQNGRELGRAAREAMIELIRELGPYDLFGGLTFDQRRCRQERMMVGKVGPRKKEGSRGTMRVPCRIPVDSAKLRFEGFVRAGERLLGRRIDYVAALESQRNGWPHLHPLLRLEGGLEEGDIEVLGGLWFSRQGYGRLEVPRSADDVTGYCAKYLAKDLGVGDLLISGRLRRCRRS